MINKPIKERAIALPFAVDDYGNINIAATQQKIWADRVRSVIGTAVEERVMRSNFGTQVPKLLWDNSDMTTEFIEREINSAFSAFLPQLQLQNVATEFNIDDQLVSVTINYSLPNDEEAIESIGIATISPNGAIYEENK